MAVTPSVAGEAVTGDSRLATDDARQLRLISALTDRLGPAEVIETHISRILLAGEFAWKFKKPVNPGFLDFSTLAARRHYCREEVRLNGRLAPDLYLGVAAFRGSAQAPETAAEDVPDAFEYAVRMRRFPQDCLADRMLAQGRLFPAHMDELARTVADFHGRIPRADPAAGHGAPARILAPVRRILDILWRGMALPEAQGMLARLDNWLEMGFSRLAPLMEARRREGFVRECHGDLHLGNIALLPEGVRIFDGIEFDPELCWIDIQNEAAFLFMDCAARGRADLGQRFLDAWLSATGDYGGLPLLRWYAVYRALVRGMVAVLRAGQGGQEAGEATGARRDALDHVRLADRLAHPPRPALILTHGPSGSGKTSLSQALLEGLPALRLRSDVERKRLFGLKPLERDERPGLYGAAATEATYAELARLAAGLLSAGHTAVVDAAFLKREQRERFALLAREMGVARLVLDCRAAPEVLRHRVAARAAGMGDASDATLAVLEAQLATLEPLGRDEPRLAADSGTESAEAVLARVRAALTA